MRKNKKEKRGGGLVEEKQALTKNKNKKNRTFLDDSIN